MKTASCRWFCLAVFPLLFPCQAAAQGTRVDYQRAEQFLPGNLRHRIYIAEVAPHWIARRNHFWYRKVGTQATEFLLVDAEQNTAGPAFDHARLAAALSKAAKREFPPTDLPFDSIDFSSNGKSISFPVDGAPWSCGVENDGRYQEASPNKEWVAYVRDRDLYAHYVPTGQIVRLTRDGEAAYDYATEIPSLRPMVAQGTQGIQQRPAVLDALIKANKNLDQLIVPNRYHGEGGNPYWIGRRWDYFVPYLLGVNPPADFAIHEERENPPPLGR
jgi:hypothetical protein